jgi:hypothetical protein
MEAKMDNRILKEMVDMGLCSAKFGNWLDFVFGCMRVAEEEIAAAIKKQPQHRDAIDATFKHACCTDLIRARQSYPLYRCHVRELISRMIAGVDIRPATKAEVLSVAIELSLQAPLVREWYALYVRCFVEVMPFLAVEIEKKIGELNSKAEEPWPGATDDLLAQMQRKFASDRGLEPKPKKGGKQVCVTPPNTTKKSMTPVASISAKSLRTAKKKPSCPTVRMSSPTRTMRRTNL